MRNFTKCYYHEQIKVDEIGGACSMHERLGKIKKKLSPNI
jgi:hypothetical protein